MVIGTINQLPYEDLCTKYRNLLQLQLVNLCTHYMDGTYHMCAS